MNNNKANLESIMAVGALAAFLVAAISIVELNTSDFVRGFLLATYLVSCLYFLLKPRL